MSLCVCVLTPHGRRHQVRCAPDTTLLQILEQTCQKFDYKPDEYDLIHHKRILDLSSILRFSGLSNNASLEMSPIKTARVESDVTLALQLEDGSRLMGTFKPSMNIYDILLALVPDKCDESLNPVVIYTRKEIYGIEELKATTLKSLGLTGGRAIFRLIHRTPDQLKTQANISTPLVRKPKEEQEPIVVPIKSVEINKDEARNVTTVDQSQDVAAEIQKEEIFVEEAISSTSKDTSTELDTNAAVEVTNDLLEDPTDIAMEVSEDISTDNDVNLDEKYNEEIIVLGERNALVFSQMMANELPFNDMPEEFYDLTVSEVKKLFVELGKKRQELENAPLKTEFLRNAEMTEMVAMQTRKNEKVVLRVLFPDRTVLQGTFVPIDKVQTVKDFVKTYLQNCNEPFDLYVTPPKQILSPDLTLQDAGCIPSALIHFGPHGKDIGSMPSNYQYLRDDILSKLTSPEAALFSAAKSRGIRNIDKQSDKSTTAKKEDLKTNESRFIPFSVPGPSSSNKSSNVPKWFKMK